ncbi:Ppx/GppA phosphatase family protein [Fodinibius sp. Rm-B-1B1-1]|uniref:Ppx/GppA phosphatase family protein n=1 Tax=Fodinibius alkaliphilus TaxID=3140241 RepID=UPI00315ADF74
MDRYSSNENSLVKASIDIGTNTALLLVANNQDDGTLEVLEEQQRIPRLGAGVDEQGYLSTNAIDRVIACLAEYKNILEEKYPDISNNEVVVTGTSAVRDAENRSVLIDLAKLKTGFDIQILSGEEEAEYTFWGAQSVLSGIDSDKSQLVLDIGGGSTEIAYGSSQLQDRYSYDMGCVRFTERFLKNKPPSMSQISDCRAAIQHMLQDYKVNIAEDAVLIGVAGTVTSLAFIDQGLTEYDGKALRGHLINRSTLNTYIDQFSEISADELAEKYPAVMKGRADIFLAGLLILDGFMEMYGFKELITSTGGIRHGAILTTF